MFKTFPNRIPLAACVPVLLLVSTLPVQAQRRDRPMGPSAVMAARLKQHPTSKWLAYYLPEDRGRIAGGIWRYVSTDLDTYFHKPDSPLMLEQPADNVIGFSSLRDAEEAGYTPDGDVLRTASLEEFNPNIRTQIAEAERDAEPLHVKTDGPTVSGSFLSQLQSRSPKLAYEALYVQGVSQAMNRMNAIAHSFKTDRLEDVSDVAAIFGRVRQAQTLFRQTVRDYNRLQVPPRFRKGDQLLRLAFRRTEQVFRKVGGSSMSVYNLNQAMSQDAGRALVSTGYAEIEIGHRIKDFGRDMGAFADSLRQKSSR